MPVTQGTGSFSLGRDCTLVVMHPLAPGGRLQLDNLMGFDPKQETAGVRVDRLDGVQMNAELPKGWTASIELERGSPAIDNLFALIEQAWHSAGSYFTATVYQYIAEPDGSTSTWQFDNVALKLDNPGGWKGDASVKQTVSFMANRRRPV